MRKHTGIPWFVVMIMMMNLGFTAVLPAARRPDLKMYGELQIGKNKRAVKWGQSIELIPADVSMISDGKPVIELYYSYKEDNGSGARGFSNRIFFNNKLVGQQPNQGVGPHQVRKVRCKIFLEPRDGKLQIRLDAGNKIRETSEYNNVSNFVHLTFNRYQFEDVPGINLEKLEKVNTNHSISNVRMTPASPAKLIQGQRVHVTFQYYTTESQGIRIVVIPHTNNYPTHGSGNNPSPVYPAGRGYGKGFFTIIRKNARVEEVRIQVYDKSWYKVLFEKVIPVNYTFSFGYKTK